MPEHSPFPKKDERAVANFTLMLGCQRSRSSFVPHSLSRPHSLKAQETGAFGEDAHEQHYGRGVNFSAKQMALLIISMFTHKNPVQVATEEEVMRRHRRTLDTSMHIRTPML